MFNLGGYVDAVYLVHFSGNRWREAYMDPELRRVGLLGNPKLHVRNTGQKPFLGLAAKSISCNPPPAYAIDLVHVTIDILTEAIERGYGRIMVMEDDIAFVNDLGKIDAAFRSLPGTFDVLHLEWVTRTAGRDVPKGRFWAKDPEFRSSGEGCAVFSRQGMSRMLGVLSSDSWKPVDTASRMLPGCYVSSPRLAIQLPFLSSGSGGVNGAAGNVLHEDWNAYAVPDDFIEGVGVIPGSADFTGLSKCALRVVSEFRRNGSISDMACSDLYRVASGMRDRNPSAYAAAMALLIITRPDFMVPYFSMARLCDPSAFDMGERRELMRMASESVSPEVSYDDMCNVPGPDFGAPSPDVTMERMEPLFREIVESSSPGDLDGPDGDMIRFAAYQLPEWRETEPVEVETDE